MEKYTYQYLVNVQYLGFRYSGWQKQPGHKTIEGMLHKTLKFILNESTFKVVGAGRTDAKVSALEASFELFLRDDSLERNTNFIELFNENLPADIRVIAIIPVSKTFNIIKDVEEKTYCYLFSFGEKNHPFAAPLMANFQQDLAIDQMINATELFIGEHDFKNFTVRDKSENKNTKRTIDSCTLKVNTELTASFFPTTSYILTVRGKGFLRYQIRLIMGALYQVGMNELSLEKLKNIIEGTVDFQFKYVAPGSGLFLKKVNFKTI